MLCPSAVCHGTTMAPRHAVARFPAGCAVATVARGSIKTRSPLARIRYAGAGALGALSLADLSCFQNFHGRAMLFPSLSRGTHCPVVRGLLGRLCVLS